MTTPGLLVVAKKTGDEAIQLIKVTLGRSFASAESTSYVVGSYQAHHTKNLADSLCYLRVRFPVFVFQGQQGRRRQAGQEDRRAAGVVDLRPGPGRRRASHGPKDPC